MSVKVKTALIIISTLIIGVFLGAMINRALMRHKIRETFSRQNPDRIIFFMEEIIQPDPAQLEQIRTVVRKHAGRMHEMRQRFFTEMQAERKSFLEEIAPLLTPEQKKRLKKGPPGFFPGRRPWPEHDRPRPERRRRLKEKYRNKPAPTEKE